LILQKKKFRVAIISEIVCRSAPVVFPLRVGGVFHVKPVSSLCLIYFVSYSVSNIIFHFFIWEKYLSDPNRYAHCVLRSTRTYDGTTKEEDCELRDNC
jgi:hypothetical protein